MLWELLKVFDQILPFFAALVGIAFLANVVGQDGADIPIHYRVALFGWPKSGKTTLITVMFWELQLREGYRHLLTPEGDTIDKVEKNISHLKTGKSLGPTKTEDVIEFAARVERKSLFGRKAYRVLFGDFPGEDYDQFVDKFDGDFSKTPYFRWAVEADAFIFLIDLGAHFSSMDRRKFRADVESSIRRTWFKLLDHHVEGAAALKDNPVIIAFTKADVLAEVRESEGHNLSSKASEMVEPTDTQNKIMDRAQKTPKNKLPKYGHRLEDSKLADIINSLAFGD